VGLVLGAFENHAAPWIGVEVLAAVVFAISLWIWHNAKARGDTIAIGRSKTALWGCGAWIVLIAARLVVFQAY
jgi:hypothetical protein